MKFQVNRRPLLPAGVCKGQTGERGGGLLRDDPRAHQVSDRLPVVVLTRHMTDDDSLSPHRAICDAVRHCPPRAPAADVYQDHLLLSGNSSPSQIGQKTPSHVC